MNILKVIKTVSISFWLWLIVSSVVGNAACFALDAVPKHGAFPKLAVAIWCVIGTLMALMHYKTSRFQLRSFSDHAKWDSVDEAVRCGTQIALISGGNLVAVSIASFLLFWRELSITNMPDSVFVPESFPMSIFFYLIVFSTFRIAISVNRFRES